VMEEATFGDGGSRADVVHRAARITLRPYNVASCIEQFGARFRAGLSSYHVHTNQLVLLSYKGSICQAISSIRGPKT
jgi:hypothetical protein